MEDPYVLFVLFGVKFTVWKIIGWTGAGLFAGRWFVQMIASRRAGKPVTPRLFWYMSVVGSVMTLAYFVLGKNDSVGIIQNSFPMLIAVYNLYLDTKHRTLVSSGLR